MKKAALSAFFVFFFWLTAASPASAAGTVLSLTPAEKAVKVGEVFNAAVTVDTSSLPVSRAAAIIDYDPELLAVTVAAGTLPLAQNEAASGKILLDTGPVAAKFSGTETLANLDIKALKSGAAKITFVYNGTKEGSSFVLDDKGQADVLEAVNNASFTVSGGQVLAGETTADLPQTGASENTFLLAFGGLLLVSGGIFLFRKNYGS